MHNHIHLTQYLLERSNRTNLTVVTMYGECRRKGCKSKGCNAKRAQVTLVFTFAFARAKYPLQKKNLVVLTTE